MTALASYQEPPAPAFLYDLDGTLIDSVYQHVIAWWSALSRLNIDLSVWRIHRCIGISGVLFVNVPVARDRADAVRVGHHHAAGRAP